MKRSEIFPSKYLSAADLGGKPYALTIEKAPLETLKTPDGTENKKVVVYFRGASKALVVNVTNFDAITDVLGEGDTDKWPGGRIELYPTEVPMRGKIVPCVRVRRPSGELQLGKANGPAPQPQRPPLKAAAVPPRDDLDDEIPSEGGVI